MDLFNRLCEENIFTQDSGVPHPDKDVVIIKGIEQQAMEMGMIAAHYLINLVQNVIDLIFLFS